MRPVRRLAGRALPLARADVDTDQIIPASYLKRLERSGYGDALFAAWRRDTAFVMNDERYRGATILVAGPNFGCGSSREHAVWALRDAGFVAVVSSSFADIFRTNCVRNGLVPVALAPWDAERLLETVIGEPELELAIDLETRELTVAAHRVPFAIEDHARRQLLEGLDDIDMTLTHSAAIDEYERSRAGWLPRVSGTA